MAGMQDFLNLAPKSLTRKVLYDVAIADGFFRNVKVEPTGVSAGGLAAAYNKINTVTKASPRGLGEAGSKKNNANIEQVPVMLKIFSEEMKLDSALQYQIATSKDLDVVTVEATTAGIAVANGLLDATINGDTTSNSKTFDGLKKIALTSPANMVKRETLIDISSSNVTTLDKAGLAAAQCIRECAGKMGRFAPNMLLTNMTASNMLIGALKAANVANDTTFQNWGKDSGTTYVNGEGATITETRFGEMIIVGIDDEFLPANEDGTVDMYLIHWNDTTGVRYLVPKQLTGKHVFMDVKPPTFKDNKLISEGYSQAITTLVVPSKQMVGKVVSIKVTDATV